MKGLASTQEVTSETFDKIRRKSKQDMIAHMAFVRNKASELSNAMTQVIADLKDKKITEDDAVVAFQDLLMDSIHEMQISVLSKKLQEVAVATVLMKHLKAEGK